MEAELHLFKLVGFFWFWGVFLFFFFFFMGLLPPSSHFMFRRKIETIPKLGDLLQN